MFPQFEVIAGVIITAGAAIAWCVVLFCPARFEFCAVTKLFVVVFPDLRS